MVFFKKARLSILIAITLFYFLSSPVYARTLKIGIVKKVLPTTFCGSYLPGGKEPLLLFEGSYGRYAWININGKDVQLTRTRSQYIKSIKRTISRYQGGDITVIFDSKIVRTIEGDLGTDESLDKIVVKVGNESKTIQTQGSCS
jgi:hypothetical protein